MYMGSGPTPAGPAGQPRQRRRHTLDPTTRCCPKPPGPARGQTGRGHRGSPSPQDHRGIGHGWHQPCRATQGPVWSRRRPSAATVVLGGPWLAPGGPGPALVAAVGCAARTGAAGGARAGRPGQAVPADLVEPPRDWGQGPAEASRVTTPGRLVWRARALRVKPRVWRGGKVRAPRDRPRLRRLRARGRRGQHLDRWGSVPRAGRRPSGPFGRPGASPGRQARAADRGGGGGGGGGGRRRPWRGSTRRAGNASRLGRAAAGPWHATPGRGPRGWWWSARWRPFARRRRVGPRHPRRRLRWRRGSRTLAGRGPHGCRVMGRGRAGHHPSHVGLPHRRSNAASSHGVGTTGSCGATSSL